MKQQSYKLVVYVPQTHLEQVRVALASAGAGKIGKYEECSFVSHGIGIFKPIKGAKPISGEIDKLNRLGEARIEVTIEKSKVKVAISAVKKVHPYEAPVIDIYKLESL
jgi:hypothetical protein